MKNLLQLIPPAVLVLFFTSCNQYAPILILNSPPVILVYSDLFSTTTEFTFQIDDPRESVFNVTLRSPLTLNSVTLFDPKGRIIQSKVGDDIVNQKAEIIHNPEMGDRIAFPNVLDPMVGMWRLHLSHDRVFMLKKSILFLSYSERFKTWLIHENNNTDDDVNAGMSIILDYIATDYGQPIAGLSPTIEVKHQGNIVDIVPVFASSVSDSIIAFSKSPSEYLVIYTTELPGDYQFTTRQAFVGKQGEIVKEAVLDLKVGPRLVSIGEISVRVEEHELSCRTKIIFQQSITVYEPGDYIVSVWIEGAKGEFEIGFGRQLTPGTTTLERTLIMDEAIKRLGNVLISSTNRSAVLLTGNGQMKLVAEGGPMAISPSIEIPETCQKDYL